ncbi:PQ-loop repeat family protein / transmembrane family protein [Zea mays]|uniref:PQ-loop repeat family protein / transmembrane family protein n=1 Tax=Zea mays TaxID=4577 RepID=A0A1D6FBF3_MAIZE|nr:PQ-loop repeat family protein / transmembrane family protein [Zea mays]
MIFNYIQGLNPLMFTFALLGNSTYVGSILVNSLDWSKLRPNLPWLVESGGCVLLDSCIILQFLYFHYRKRREPSDEHDNADKA